MPVLLLKWRPIQSKNIHGSDIELELPELFDISYRGRLLSEILAMKVKQPISLQDAASLAALKQDEAFDARHFTNEPGHYQWYGTHFVEWVSSLGYHIEITGDEFDLIYPSAESA